MDEWLRKNKYIFDSWIFKLSLALLIIALSIGVIFGPDYFAYVAGIIIFGIFYISAKVSEFETDLCLSDADIQQMKQDLTELEEELVNAHIQVEEKPDDIEIKLFISSLKEEIETLKNTIPKD